MGERSETHRVRPPEMMSLASFTYPTEYGLAEYELAEYELAEYELAIRGRCTRRGTSHDSAARVSQARCGLRWAGG
jgi:hypothetical protein